MQQAADVENVIVTSISLPAETGRGCARRHHNPQEFTSRSLKANSAVVAKIEMVVVFKAATNIVINEAAFLKTPGLLALVPTDTENLINLKIDNIYVPPNATSIMTIAVQEMESVQQTEPVVLSTQERLPILPIALGGVATALLIGFSVGVMVMRRHRQSSSTKKHADDMESAFKCQTLDTTDLLSKHRSVLSVGVGLGGMRLRRCESNEERIRDLVSFPPSLFLSLFSLSFILSLFPFFPLFSSFSFVLFLFLLLSLFLSFSLPLHFFLSLSPSSFLSPSLSLFISLSLTLSFSLPPSFLSLSLSCSFSLPPSFLLYPSLFSVSVSLLLFLSLSLVLSLPFSILFLVRDFSLRKLRFLSFCRRLSLVSLSNYISCVSLLLSVSRFLVLFLSLSISFFSFCVILLLRLSLFASLSLSLPLAHTYTHVFLLLFFSPSFCVCWSRVPVFRFTSFCFNIQNVVTDSKMIDSRRGSIPA